MGQFAEIRPYNDDEVSPVLERLVNDKEFIAAVASLRLGGWHKCCKPVVYPIVKHILRKQVSGISTVREVQALVKSYMDGMVDKTTSQCTVSGLEKLDPKQSYLFISNHRDIALDPAFVNYAVSHNGFDMVRIAIGDNLLTKPYVSDLMRLNKSFIVKRSAKGRAMLAAYKLLSRYIRHSIEVDHNPIWIAQREGRAKDGNDKTEPAMIKMIAMSQHKQQESFSEFINKMRIVPVAISYELDPCDGAKAKELYEKATHGHYQKGEHEDVTSIALGISGDKDHVHVSFGEPLQGEFDNADDVAAAIDQQIFANYVLHPTNFIAHKILHGSYPEGVYSDQRKPFSITGLESVEQAFQKRIDALPAEHRPYALGIYANPIDRIRERQAQG
ncbi:1-acyl-sn-glycerol-3-phosphate acyltransferase [Dasania sp. GY-MA-18]|uniref:1-acyl-sn-glycerol-3-phosphate acyltransferase n=1 Tax=Dasania phycosphaerae TaxID=2950436 RepID=A0A9J6RQS6_9GAMM|nr:MULTISPECIES: 1-acyl-sn-glycerol-3-phosphate acyltransferase [Dasania]MCR8924141.1 1-acyl-sn-glycerol-3-phosphate acyltransferase [Dasania sp. GY-MA-18]MCZ0866714.1 1-acyl-sn-glycerol-3-phosphate acyltransferase [Dasania phycosphaerae]MCZ0870299.1 1-acyl-sn-glycerol-3-phosphate acyltransferase [Dasania phycosphaerae]